MVSDMGRWLAGLRSSEKKSENAPTMHPQNPQNPPCRSFEGFEGSLTGPSADFLAHWDDHDWQAAFDERAAILEFDVWDKYEKIAMHFNDLIIKLRTQALAGVAALSTLVTLFAKSDVASSGAWGIAAFIFGGLCLAWVAIWIIDFSYYNRLLTGAV